MKVLSLFDGMSCAMLALLNRGIEVERYVAYEIDKYAIQTASHNFPMIEQRGDVFKADFTEFKGFDYVMGGRLVLIGRLPKRIIVRPKQVEWDGSCFRNMYELLKKLNQNTLSMKTTNL